MVDLEKMFDCLHIQSSQKKYREVFNTLKPYLKIRINQFLDTLKTSNKGRKRMIDWDKFFIVFFI